jgi:hypothetical protein
MLDITKHETVWGEGEGAGVFFVHVESRPNPTAFDSGNTDE